MSAFDQNRHESVQEGRTGTAKQGIAIGNGAALCLRLILLKKSSDVWVFSSPGAESQPPARLNIGCLSCSVFFPLFCLGFCEKASFFFFLPLWLIPVMQSRGSNAWCQEKFVWMLKNVEEGLACTMSFAFPLKMLGEKSEGFHL